MALEKGLRRVVDDPLLRFAAKQLFPEPGELAFSWAFLSLSACTNAAESGALAGLEAAEGMA